MAERVEVTTTNAGGPVASDEHSLTQGDGGGILLHDHYLVEIWGNEHLGCV